MDSRVWDTQVTTFCEHYRVISYDRQFCGKTKRNEGGQHAAGASSLEDLKRIFESRINSPPSSSYNELKSLLDWLGIEKCHLLGLEEGGQVALEFAVVYPEITDKLLLVNTRFPVLSDFEDPGSREKLWSGIQRGIEKAQGFREAIQKLVHEGDPEPLVESKLADPLYSKATPQTRQRLRTILSENAFSVFEGFEPQSHRLALLTEDRLKEIDAPTLLILSDGGRDPLARALDDRLEELIPTLRTVVLPDASPMVNMDRPEEFNRMVLEFLGTPRDI
ncbi:MAG: alpha/beta hydrolase [Rubrobacteraceae bacterium]|nr:alpha/beta hydrolase [Rubrobacteraceae bacterium]